MSADTPGTPKRRRLNDAFLALGGMVVGALVGIGVQVGVESTGLLGPSVDSLIAEQASNFDSVNARLDEIRNGTSDPEMRKRLAGLGKLLERQGELSKHATSELTYLTEQVAGLREKQLSEQGYAGGADFWLKNGESVTIGEHGHVFALLSARSNVADVNYNGERKRMLVGDSLQVGTDAEACTVLFKLATPREDKRVGFDLQCG
jgi:hypothetical protein